MSFCALKVLRQKQTQATDVHHFAQNVNVFSLFRTVCVHRLCTFSRSLFVHIPPSIKQSSNQAIKLSSNPDFQMLKGFSTDVERFLNKIVVHHLKNPYTISMGLIVGWCPIGTI